MMFFTKGYDDTIQDAVQNAIFSEDIDDVVVVKGSRGIGLDVVVDKLVGEGSCS